VDGRQLKSNPQFGGKKKSAIEIIRQFGGKKSAIEIDRIERTDRHIHGDEIRTMAILWRQPTTNLPPPRRPPAHQHQHHNQLE
jgi:hypothetical protein